MAEGTNGARYILITQCLQNDLFLNADCRLYLSEHVARTMLLGKRQYDVAAPDGSRRRIPKEALREGPLGQFLEATIGRRARGADGHGTLHVINIRDWHEHDDSYDVERRNYGPHCEAGTWGADYIEGLGEFLDPAGTPCEEQARAFERGSVRVYHVHSDSLFDFTPRASRIGPEQRKFEPSALEDILDVLVQGADEDLERMRALLVQSPHLDAICELGREVDDAAPGRSSARVYVGVIGVYTDLKIKTLLTGIRTRYNVSNLAVSDTFTASATLERHLAGLDYAKKVLSVEVIHGINDLVRFLGGTAAVDDESDLVAGDSYARYQSFFQDQQNVLGYQHERLEDYLMLTERRSVKLYNTISRSNRFLIAWGGAFLVLTLVLALLSAIWPGRFDWKLPAITGGLSLAQFVGVFFRASGSDLQRNLTNLAVFKMILESHSLKTAFARYHLTTPQTLRELQTKEDAEAAARQIEALRHQLDVIAGYDRGDFDDLERLGFRADRDGADVTEPAAADAKSP